VGLYRKKGSPFWWYSLRAGGRRFYGSTKEKKKGKAEVVFARRMAEAQDGDHAGLAPRRKRVQFGELAEAYLEFTARQRDFRSKAARVNFLVDWFGGGVDIAGITLAEVERLQAELRVGRKASTVNRYLACLKHMVTKAVDWDMADERVLKAVRRVKQLRENNRRLRFLTRVQGAALAAACAPHLAPVVLSALNSGMRKGEILGLTWGQVDFRRGFIRLNVTKNGEGRNVPINSTLRVVLSGLTRRLRVEWVFCDKKGRRFLDVKKGFAAACRRAVWLSCSDACGFEAEDVPGSPGPCSSCGRPLTRVRGISDFRFHDLRHTFASWLVMAGVDLLTVKELLGHKSLTMTLRYSHLAPEHSSRAVEVLDLPGEKFTGDNLVTISERKKGATL